MNSFFGGLAAGKTYAELSRRGAPLTGEILTTERIVGALMPVVRGKADPASFRAGLVNLYEALGEPVPAFVTDDFVAAVAARYRALLGRWEATPFGREMELKFEV